MKGSKLIDTIALSYAFGMSAFILIGFTMQMIVGDTQPSGETSVFVAYPLIMSYAAAVMRSCIIGYRQL